MVIEAKDGVVIENVHITSPHGDCLRIVRSRHVTIRNVEIGPCAGNGVSIEGSDTVTVVDSYIHPQTQSPGCCDRNDGIFAVGTRNLLLQGNVVAFGESNIEVHDGTHVTIRGNFLLNPRGPTPRGQQIQCWSHAGDGAGPGCRNVAITNNYLLSSRDRRAYTLGEATEDSINLGYTAEATISNNFIGGGHSRSGCGMIADKGARNIVFKGNRLVDTGQCGIGIADGTGNVVETNLVANRNPVSGAGNSGIYVWQFYGSKGRCANTRVTGNIAVARKPDGTHNGFWKGPGCDALVLANNHFDREALALIPSARLQPPSIPPEPFTCAVRSPYSNNRSRLACAK